jgi:hypothetical protein
MRGPIENAAKRYAALAEKFEAARRRAPPFGASASQALRACPPYSLQVNQEPLDHCASDCTSLEELLCSCLS